MGSWLSGLRRSLQGHRPAPKRPPRRLGRGARGPTARSARPWLEPLENRVVPSASDWAMPNYSSAGTRDNTAEHTLSVNNVGNLHVLWNYATAGPVAGTVAVVDNVAYAGDSTGMFYAVNSDGTLLWKTQLNGTVNASALVTNGTVIIGTRDTFNSTSNDRSNDHPGSIYGLDAKTGKVKWQIQPNTSQRAAIWGSPTLVGKNVAIGVASGDEQANVTVNGVTTTLPPTSRGSLILLNPKNGHVIWQTYTVTDQDFDNGNGVTGAAIWSTPAYDSTKSKAHPDGIIYAGTGNNYGVDETSPTNGNSDAVMAFDAKTGDIIWVNQRTKGDNWDSRFVTNAPDFDFGDSPHVYTLSTGEKVVAEGQKSGFFWVFDAKDGHVVNIQSDGKEGLQLTPGSSLGGLFATAAFDPKTDVVFANTRDTGTTPASGHLFAISGDGKTVLWQFDTPSPAQSGVAVANGVVYFETVGGILYALNEKTGALLAKIAAGGNVSGPSISNGVLYMGQGNLLQGNANGPKGIAAIGLSDVQQGTYVQSNLVSDIPGEAQVTDPNLKNPWGVSFSSSSPFWVSNQATSNSTLYTVKGNSVSISSLVVDIPKTSSGPQGPTGQVRNNDPNTMTDFLVGSSAASFIFASLNGTISAWNSGSSATIEATTPMHVYTGLAMAKAGSNTYYLYAANDAVGGSIDVFDAKWQSVNLGASAFVDPLLPKDLNLVPFNIQLIGDKLYVTYAPSGRNNQVNAVEGDGAVAVFDTSGNFIQQLVAGSKLASPWGVALAPASFGKFGGDLLVGNFAYNYAEINAFDPNTGAYLGTLTDANGNVIRNQALWDITFGNGGNGGDPNTLYFAAGINAEADGLFGSIQAASTLSENTTVADLSGATEQTISTRSVFSTNSRTTKEGGDQNPYGVAFVPQDYQGGGELNAGDILVSNFNNDGANGGEQGTGTTIVRITPSGQRSVFFHSDQAGLSTALGILKRGFVIVGNVPTTDGTFDTIDKGSLQILDSNGNVVRTLVSDTYLDGPWDLAINDQGDKVQVFVSNVLSGTVTRIDLSISDQGVLTVNDMVQIASGYKHEENDSALVVGPTGLAYDAAHDILYVASTDDNAIYAIHDAGRTNSDHGVGDLVYQDATHLHGPLGLVLAPNGDLIVANGDAVNADDSQPSELVEFTTKGKFVGQFSISSESGAAFGIALSSDNGVLRFAAVNDADNTLDVWTFASPSDQDNHHGD
jgi:uncharacterized protein (TIGR03118 family)